MASEDEAAPSQSLRYAMSASLTCSAFPVPPAGAKLIRNSVPVPVAFANRISVGVEGKAFPPSHRATASCFVPIRSANCACVRPVLARAWISSPARANSSSSASYQPAEPSTLRRTAGRLVSY